MGGDWWAVKAGGRCVALRWIVLSLASSPPPPPSPTLSQSWQGSAPGNSPLFLHTAEFFAWEWCTHVYVCGFVPWVGRTLYRLGQVVCTLQACNERIMEKTWLMCTVRYNTKKHRGNFIKNLDWETFETTKKLLHKIRWLVRQVPYLGWITFL